MFSLIFDLFGYISLLRNDLEKVMECFLLCFCFPINIFQRHFKIMADL